MLSAPSRRLLGRAVGSRGVSAAGIGTLGQQARSLVAIKKRVPVSAEAQPLALGRRYIQSVAQTDRVRATLSLQKSFFFA